MITFEEIKKDPEIRTYIEKADSVLKGLGYTEHSFAHVTRCAEVTGWLLKELDYSDRTIELAKIAAFLHDIGNMVNRTDHAHHGAILAFQLLNQRGMDPAEICDIVTAIGHHDEDTAHTITPINSALILADKSDVRHTRVRDYEPTTQDIHDRVNYAVKKSELSLDKKENLLILSLTIDTKVSSVADYFEIFLGRMMLCRRAAVYFGQEFKLIMNGNDLF